MAKNYQFDTDERVKMVGEMISAASDNGAQTCAIMKLAAWYDEGEIGEEPDLGGYVSRKMENAILTDLHHIYREQRPEGVFGSEYNREFIRIKRENARKAAARRARKTGMDTLRRALTL